MRVFGLALVVAVVGCGGDDDDGGDGPDLISEPRCVDALDMKFKHNYLVGNTDLRANTLSIVTPAGAFEPPTEPLMSDLSADEANRTLPDSTNFDMRWAVQNEDGMRWVLYFASDGVDWWARQMRTYDGSPSTEDDWIYYDRELFRCPLGQAYVGDVTFESDLGDGSVVAEDLWVRAFVDGDAPGVQEGALEKRLRPFCSWLRGCSGPDSINEVNNCIYEYSIRSLAFRDEPFDAALSCLAQSACKDETALFACWSDNRPALASFQTDFKSQCEAFSTTCSGAPDPICGGLTSNFFYVDLPFLSELLVEKMSACVAPTAACSAGLGYCLDVAAAPYGLEFLR